jgi:hypothetical protein
MRWHKEGIHDSEDTDIMSHPVDAEAWQALDSFDPEFVTDHMSVCFGRLGRLWTVFMMPYNLPHNKCPEEGFIFLALMILGSKEPKKQMNIFLCTLIE